MSDSSIGVASANAGLSSADSSGFEADNDDDNLANYVTGKEAVYALANQVKEMVKDNVHFVFFWGLPQAGKTHILYTLWLCLEQMGMLSLFGEDGDMQVQFRYHLDKFTSCVPAAPTKWNQTYMISCCFKPNSARFRDLPPVKFAFVEAAGETTARQLTEEKVFSSKGGFEFPALHNAILLHAEARISHILVSAVNLPTTLRMQQDANLMEVLTLLEKKRGNIRQSDEFLLTVSKWDTAIQDGVEADPLVWLQGSLGRTLAQFKEMSIKSSWAYYQTYITANWAMGRTNDEKEVSYAQDIKLDSARCLVHWLYRAATGNLLLPEKEPKAPPTKWQRGIEKAKVFFKA